MANCIICNKEMVGSHKCSSKAEKAREAAERRRQARREVEDFILEDDDFDSDYGDEQLPHPRAAYNGRRPSSLDLDVEDMVEHFATATTR